MVLAAKFDTWFRRAVRASDMVVALDEVAAGALPIALDFTGDVAIFRPDNAEAVLAEQLAWSRLHQALVPSLSERGKALPPEASDVQEACAALTDLAGTGLVATAEAKPLYAVLERLVRTGRFTDARAIAAAAQNVPGLDDDDPMVAGYRTVSELGATARTGADVAAVVAGVLAAADGALEGGDRAAAATWAALAMDLLLHRELHSDGLSSPLVDAPARYLAPLRASKVGRLLTTPSAPPAADSPPPERSRLHVTMTPGAYGSFHVPVRDALQQAPRTEVKVLDLPGRHPGLRSMKMDPSLVRMRLDHALGHPVRGFTSARRELREADVVFSDWADKSAMLASLSIPARARLVVRIHGVDTLRPWLHLIDWSRVDDLICVSAPMETLVRDVLGEHLAGTRTHVLPNVIDAGRFELQKPDDASRVLCMVGWAQRVKDPLWVLEVLAGLVAKDSTWRLMLIGADFPRNPTASGREYAAAFRERAMADDIRENITYVGFTDDIPRYLREAGFVLSASRRESWHLGAMEGVAAGAVPVVRDWPILSGRGAARQIFPDDWVVADVEEAIGRILAHADPGDWRRASRTSQREVVELSDLTGTTRAYRRIVLGEYAHLADLTADGNDEGATAVVRDALTEPKPDGLLLREAINATFVSGEMTLRLAALDRLLEVEPEERVARVMRGYLGRLRETSAEWVPTISGQVQPVDPVPGRILHVLKISMPHRESGYSVRGRYTLSEQRRVGLDPVGVTALDFPRLIGVDDAAETEDVAGVEHHRLFRDMIPEREPVDSYLDAWATELARKAMELRPEVIHAHSGHRGFETALVALSVGRALDVPVVYEVRGFFESLWRNDPLRAERGQAYRRRRETEERCMRAASAVVTLSEAMRADIISRGIDPDRVFVVPNAVDAGAFPPRPRSEDLVARYGLEGKFVFGYVSNLDHGREGHELLVHAAVALRAQGVPATALIVGDGRRQEELEALAGELDAGDAVIFTGRVRHDRVHDYYALCDVFVVPRVAERAARLVTPLKPYEAMALGIPLVVSDLDALREVIGQGERGTAFTAGSVDSLVEVLTQAHQDPNAFITKAARAREWVVSTRTWQANAQIYRDIYDGLTRSEYAWPAVPVLEQGADRADLEAQIARLRDELAGLTADDEAASGGGPDPGPDLIGLRWARQHLRAQIEAIRAGEPSEAVSTAAQRQQTNTSAAPGEGSASP